MKIKTLIACLLAVSCTSTSVFAQITAYTNGDGNSITVSGTVSDDDVQILLLKPGKTISDAESAAVDADKTKLGNVIEYFGQVSVKDNTIKTDIPMRDDAVIGTYTLVLNGEEYKVDFASKQDRTSKVSDAKNDLTNGTFSQFANSNAKYFCNGSMYDSLTNKGNVATYAASMLNKDKTLPDAEFLPKLTSAMNMGVIMEALNENKINDFGMIRTMTNDSDLKVPMDKVDLIKASSVQNVISDVSGKNFTSPEMYAKLLSESIFINVLNNGENMSAPNKRIFFDIYANGLLNLTEYNKLSDNQKTSAINQVVAENLSFSQLQAKLNDICKNMSLTNITTPDGGGAITAVGSVSVSGGGLESGSQGMSADVIATPGYVTDLDECAWAKMAIECLINNKMISGYEDNTFKPFKNISRAEFTTILARKYLTIGYYEQNFSDVSRDKWFFNYVESAYNNGIISGVDTDIFAPDENISRQDMAVILCRLAEFFEREITGDSTEFLDDANIASYAKDAVYKLKSVGIVNGDEKGNFNPTASATRAEAAQMIYSFVKYLG